MLTPAKLQTSTEHASEVKHSRYPVDYRHLSAMPAKAIETDKEARAPFMRRFAAISIYDYIACLWLATIAVVALRLVLGSEGQRLTANAPIQLLTLTVFLFRDSFFNGRGFGKGLLGLSVIDQKTKHPANALQSMLRNLVFLGPYFLYHCCSIVLPAPSNQGLLEALKNFGISYAILMLLAESILMLRGEGRRLADRLSGTTVVKLKTRDLC